MRQKVSIKLAERVEVGEDGLELCFEAPNQFDGVYGVHLALTKEQAVSLGKVIRAKYGDAE